MDSNKETLETWNNIASLYQDKFMDLEFYNDTYDYICSSIVKPKAKLLELGCGPGNITRYLLTQRPDFAIFGVDIAPNMIELAKQNNPTASFAIMDCRQINTLDTKYDGIIGGFCLPYMSSSECKELIYNSYNLLYENGLIYLSFVEGDPEKSEFKVGSNGRIYFNYHNLIDIENHLIECGFKKIKIFKVKYPISEVAYEIHTIISAKKGNTQ